MANSTDPRLRSAVIYSVFVRNHTPQGTLEALRADLGRIRSLGVDMLWLMPIHPIGIAGRKGTMGSPYAIRDYRAVHPDYGSREDLRRLTADAHALGMKVLIDVVYNHTAPDAVLAREHPEWFWKNAHGSMGNRFGDWSDVVDLDYRQKDLWTEQIDTLKMWAEIVDGFRCDVAALVPLEFWLRAREAVESVRPGAVWLAESVEPSFVRAARLQGLDALSDAEIYQAFDIAYDYDIFPELKAYFRGQGSLENYLAALNRQESIYPGNYVKLHFLENHDNPRARFWLHDLSRLRNWTAFLYFLKGAVLLYAGQERALSHLPELFEKDPVDWTGGEDLSEMLRALYAIRQDPIFQRGGFFADLRNGVIHAERVWNKRHMTGLFPLNGPAAVPVNAPDGRYRDLISGSALEVRQGACSVSGQAAIFPWQTL